MKRYYDHRRSDGTIERRYEHVPDSTGGYDASAELEKRARRTPAGRPYISREDYFEVIEEAEQAATYTREGEHEQLSADELHMQWALCQDPEMTTEDYMHNLKNIPGYGPRPAKQMLEHPLGLPVRTRRDK